MSSKTHFIGAVEIGTSKTIALIGEFTGRELAIIGYGECPSRGVVKGVVVDYKAASDCTHYALQSAEQSAGERIDFVFLAQTGGHLEGFYNEASVTVKAADNMVSQLDIDMVCSLATSKELPAGRMVVHNIRRPFRLDGRVVPHSPEHLVGRRLDSGYWIVHGQENKLADNIHVIRGFNLSVRELILSSLASGHMVTTPEERQNGILAIDIGAGTTDFVLYRDGGPFVTGIVPVGGSHLTNDLALGLRLTEGQSDKLKVHHGRAMVSPGSKGEKVWLDGNFAIGDRQFPRHTIEQILSARTWEIFEVVRKKLGTAFSPEKCTAGVVLTGGTSKLPAIADCAAKVFGIPAHLGEPPATVSENLRDPGYNTALGLLYYGLASHAEASSAPGRRKPGFLQKLFSGF
ncbi:MAG: cell division protein FtsA [Opitutaceae bacterium]